MKQTKGLFIGFDKVLIYTNSGKETPMHSDDWRFNPTAIDTIRNYLKSSRYKICIITNQFNIQKGTLSEKSFLYRIEDVCKHLERLYDLPKNSIAFNYSKIENSYRSLPQMGMLYELALEYEIDLRNSIFIGNTNEEEVAANAIMPFIKIF